MSNVTDVTQNASPSRQREALDRVRPELNALPDKELRVINIDPLAAVTIVRGALPRLTELALLLATKTPDFEPRHLTQLETYALALMQAHIAYIGIDGQSTVLRNLSAKANQLREDLLRDAINLAKRGCFPEQRLARLKGPNGHRNIASDILTLATLLRDCWSVIMHKTTVTPADLDQAEILGDELILALGNREKVTALAATAARERQQIYTLFVRAYEEIRSSVIYVRRHEGDADEIAPTLYPKRKLARRKANPEPAPIVDPFADPAPTPDLALASAIDAKPEVEPAPTQIRVGLPGSDPFLH